MDGKIGQVGELPLSVTAMHHDGLGVDTLLGC